MAYGEIYLLHSDVSEDPVLLSPYGRKLSYSKLEFSRQKRSSNSKLGKDIINKKTIVTLNYTMIDSVDLEVFENFNDVNDELILQIHDRSGAGDYVNSFTMLMDTFDKTRYRLFGKNSRTLYTNVKFTFREV